jgi:tetratricopeptide (TPR) repeat protein
MAVSLTNRVLAGRRAARLCDEGMARYVQLDLDGAEERSTRAFASAVESGSSHLIGRAGEQLYLVLRRRRRYADALPVVEAVLAANVRLHGADHPLASAWRDQLILLMAQLERFEDAEPVCRDKVAAARRRFGAASLEAGRALVTLGWCLRMAGGRLGEAEAVYREALSVLEGAVGHEGAETGRALSGLAVVLTRKGDFEGAEQLLRRARDNWARVGATELAAAVSEHLIDLYVASERYDVALDASARRRSGARRVATAAVNDAERRLWDLERHAFLLRWSGQEAEADGLERRAAYLRAAIEKTAGSAGGGWLDDPTGPVLDLEAVVDWQLSGPQLKRAC